MPEADLNDDIYALVEAAELDEDQERRLEHELGRQYHLITRDDRLDTMAKDVVRHFLGRGFQGKAMVVSIDKATALRMHDKVRKHWDAERVRVERELGRLSGSAAKADQNEVRELQQRLNTLVTTEMALIVSPGQNQIEQMKSLGLDIVPHRKRMNDEDLAERFKNAKDPLRLVFLCAMWLTGFDAPSCSTVYLDKPMRNHTLMQTIARANRVFPEKHSGLIVDYANVFASLEKLLRANRTRADYLAKFEELIESYNAGSRGIEDLFKDLLALSRALSDEEQRHVREQLTEDELTVFDLLTRPGPDLSPDERDEVKKVARQLLERVRAALVLNWREKSQARAQVRLAIEDALDEGLPRVYTPDVYRAKCTVLFEHVFESFSTTGEAAR